MAKLEWECKLEMNGLLAVTKVIRPCIVNQVSTRYQEFVEFVEFVSPKYAQKSREGPAFGVED